MTCGRSRISSYKDSMRPCPGGHLGKCDLPTHPPPSPGSPGILQCPLYTVPREPGSRACISPASAQTRPFDSISEASALAESGLVEGTASRQGLVSSEQSSRGRPRYAGVSVCVVHHQWSGQSILGQACGCLWQHPSWSWVGSTESPQWSSGVSQ